MNRENQSDDILFDLLKTASEIEKEAAPWKNKLLAPALGLGIALAPGAKAQQPTPQRQEVSQASPSVRRNVTVRYNTRWEPEKVKSCAYVTGRPVIEGTGNPPQELLCETDGEGRITPHYNYEAQGITLQFDDKAAAALNDTKKWAVMVDCTREGNTIKCEY